MLVQKLSITTWFVWLPEKQIQQTTTKRKIFARGIRNRVGTAKRCGKGPAHQTAGPYFHFHFPDVVAAQHTLTA